MSTLKVNKLRDTAGSADAITLDPNGGAVLAGVTTVTSVKVGAAVTISESGIEASGIGITCASINGTQIGGRRNLIINGAMNIAQRGTSSTTSGRNTVDRFQNTHNGTDEAPTQAQVDVASGTTPYTLGFRKSFKVTNGNQTSGAGAGDWVNIGYKPEAQDIANSGWNYLSSSSYITLSFWAKASVAQTYQVRLASKDGTAQGFVFEYALTADTWTKITKTIPGNSNLQFDNDNGIGMEIEFLMFIGTTYTSASPTLNAWGTYSYLTSRKDMTSTWYTTNDATFELTGVQLEVGPQATSFEHRSFGEELSLCQRYYLILCQGAASTPNFQVLTGGFFYTDSSIRTPVRYPVRMRTTPSLESSNNTNDFKHFHSASNGATTNYEFDTFSSMPYVGEDAVVLASAAADVGTQGFGCYTVAQTSTAKLALTAEL